MEPQNVTVEVIDFFGKPLHDKKQYRAIRLANEMKVMLIHDDRVQVQEGEYLKYWPSCTLTISVGSLSDPSDCPGLAKLVARMMYQSDNDFVRFISYDHSEDNSNNRMPEDGYRCKLNFLEEVVDDEQTTYSFRSRASTLDEALLRYAKVLKMPFHMRDSITQTREEYREKFDLLSQNVWTSNYVVDQLLSLLGSPGHPARNFAWGEMKPLNENMDDDTLYQRIEEFKCRHYSAHRMSLCLQTNFSLDEMQEMVVRHFSSVPNNGLPGLDFTPFTHENAFQSKFHEKVYFVRRDHESSKVQLTWCMPPPRSTDGTQPEQFLSYIMHTICDGSLREYLMKKKMADTYYHFDRIPVLRANAIFSLFMIEVELFKNEIKHLDDVIEVIFSYIRLNLQILKDSKVAEPLYRDFVNINNLPQFKEMLPEQSTIHFAQALMNFPSTRRMSNDYDADAIQKAIDTLNERIFSVIVISNQKYNESIEFESKDENCRFEYTERKMPDKWTSFWNDPRAIPELSLPSPNPYIPTDFTILYDGSQSVPEHPIKVYESDVSELWYRLDDKYFQPVTHCRMYLEGSTAYSPAENAVFISMLWDALSSRIFNQSYCYREQAGWNVSYWKHLGDLEIALSGPSQNFHSAIDDLTKELANIHENISEEEFDTAKGYELNSFELSEYELDSEVVYTGDILRSIILTEHVTYHERNRCAKQVQFSDLQKFCRQFFEQARIHALIQGNLTGEAAVSILQTFETNFGSKKNSNQTAVKPRGLKLPPGSNHLLLNALHRTQYQSATKTYYQIGPASKRTTLIAEFLTAINRNPRFDKQSKTFLGNCYFSWEVLEDCGILGYAISILTPEKENPIDVVEKLIGKVRNAMLSLIEDLSAEEFQEVLSTLKQTYEIQMDNDLMEEMSRNVKEIRNGEYLFDRHTKMLEIISSINQSEVIRFFREHRNAEDRVLSIKVIGYTKEPESIDTSRSYDPPPAEEVPDDVIYAASRKLDSGYQINNIDEFKKILAVYQ